MFTLHLWGVVPRYKYYGTGWVYPLSQWLVMEHVKEYDDNCKAIRFGNSKVLVDRYYILRLVWLFFLSIRYWIIREPILFAVINFTVFINFLQDHNRWLLFIYLLCIQLSRFMFFMGSEYERFNYKRWLNEWIFMGTKVNYYFEFLGPNPYQSGPFIPRSGVIFKYTWTNLNLAWFYNTRYEQSNPGFEWFEDPVEIKNGNRSFRYVKLSAIYDYWATKAFRRYEHRFHMDIWYDHEFSELRWWWGMRLYKDIQKFVKCNQMFWLAILILIIYIEL